MSAYSPRLLDALLTELLSGFPALWVVGPRAAGKTTTAARLARTIVHLDQPTEAGVFEADPDLALSQFDEPILLDEWQAVPQVLGAVKRAVDTNSRRGRFLVAGSVNARLSPWPGTGRLLRVPMYGMTVREQRGEVERPPFIDRLAAGEQLETPAERLNLRDYVDWAMRGGFPEPALRLDSSQRRRWLEGYVDQLVARDIPEIDGRRDTSRLRRFVEAYALQSATVVENRTLYEAADINRKTAIAYEQLLADTFIAESMPAWTTNRLKRLVLSPKRFVTDPSLLPAVLRMDVEGVLRDAKVLGRLIETFVAAQLRPEVPVCTTHPRLFHLRQAEGRHEVDMIVELGGQRVIGIEIKAGSAPRAADAKHLVWLRDQLGEQFVRGVVLHTGPYVFELDERITAAPISTLWS